MSEADVKAALAKANVPPAIANEIINVNKQSQIDGLRTSEAILALLALIALPFTPGIPSVQPGTQAKPRSSPASPTRALTEPHIEGVTMLSRQLNGVSRDTSRDGAGRARKRAAVAMIATVALVAVSGCGSSKPAYCSDRTNLENSVKGLTSLNASSGLSGLKTQATTIESDATSLVSAAKSDFPTETSAVKSSVAALKSAIAALPSSPSATQIAALGATAASVVNSVNSFVDASKSKCS